METILIVDDEKNYLRVLSAVLEEEGYEVLTALSGREALEIQETSDPDPTFLGSLAPPVRSERSGLHSLLLLIPR